MFKRAFPVLCMLMFPGLSFALEVDGIEVGGMPCTDGLETLFALVLQDHQAMEESAREDPTLKAALDSRLPTLRALLGKPKEDSTSYTELNRLHVLKLKKEALEASGSFQPLPPVDSPRCQIVTYEGLPEELVKAMELEPEKLGAEKQALSECPFRQLFHASAINRHLLCDQGRVVGYGKAVTLSYEKLQRELGRKYGPARSPRWFLKSPVGGLGGRELFQVSTLYPGERVTVALTNDAANVGSPLYSRKVLQKDGSATMPLPEKVEHKPLSKVFYLSREAIDTFAQNKKAQNGLVNRRNRKRAEKTSARDEKVIKAL